MQPHIEIFFLKFSEIFRSFDNEHKNNNIMHELTGTSLFCSLNRLIFPAVNWLERSLVTKDGKTTIFIFIQGDFL